VLVGYLGGRAGKCLESRQVGVLKVLAEGGALAPPAPPAEIESADPALFDPHLSRFLAKIAPELH
jgi:hypothetical protein